MKKPHNKAPKYGQQGSFVLEALIAILLFAVGILAIVGLQAASIGNAASAKDRTEASLLANQIIGQMWVADKTNATLAANFCGPAASSVCSPSTNSIYPAWANSVANALPGVTVGGTNAPTVSINASSVAAITVYWQAPKDIAPHNYTIAATINN